MENGAVGVRELEPGERGRAVSVLVMAFAADPVARWAFPDARQYLSAMPRVVEALGGRAFEHGSAYGTGDFGGVALWLPPGAGPDEEALGSLEESIRDEEREDFTGFVARQMSVHPTEPHWYLPLIGVDPSKHGQGYGSALLSHRLRVCDREGMPAYLEATTARNKALYERHGFETVDEISFGSSPTMWAMLRKSGAK